MRPYIMSELDNKIKTADSVVVIEHNDTRATILEQAVENLGGIVNVSA